MAKKKKTIVAFLILLSLLLSVVEQLEVFSQRIGIPLPFLLVISLLLYLIWKEEPEE